MNSVLVSIKSIIAIIGGYIAMFLGGFDGILIALCIFALVDYITGVIAAIVEKKLCSRIGFKGIARKILMFLMVGVTAVLNTNVLGWISRFRESTCSPSTISKSVARYSMILSLSEIATS